MAESHKKNGIQSVSSPNPTQNSSKSGISSRTARSRTNSKQTGCFGCISSRKESGSISPEIVGSASNDPTKSVMNNNSALSNNRRQNNKRRNNGATADELRRCLQSDETVVSNGNNHENRKQDSTTVLSDNNVHAQCKERESKKLNGLTNVTRSSDYHDAEQRDGMSPEYVGIRCLARLSNGTNTCRSDADSSILGQGNTNNCAGGSNISNITGDNNAGTTSCKIADDGRIISNELKENVSAPSEYDIEPRSLMRSDRLKNDGACDDTGMIFAQKANYKSAEVNYSNNCRNAKKHDVTCDGLTKGSDVGNENLSRKKGVNFDESAADSLRRSALKSSSTDVKRVDSPRPSPRDARHGHSGQTLKLQSSTDSCGKNSVSLPSITIELNGNVTDDYSCEQLTMSGAEDCNGSNNFDRESDSNQNIYPNRRCDEHQRNNNCNNNNNNIHNVINCNRNAATNRDVTQLSSDRSASYTDHPAGGYNACSVQLSSSSSPRMARQRMQFQRSSSGSNSNSNSNSNNNNNRSGVPTNQQFFFNNKQSSCATVPGSGARGAINGVVRNCLDLTDPFCRQRVLSNASTTSRQHPGLVDQQRRSVFTFENIQTDSGGQDDEHNLIAQYVARLTNVANNNRLSVNSAEASNHCRAAMSNLTMDRYRMVVELEARNREIAHEIQWLRWQQEQAGKGELFGYGNDESAGLGEATEDMTECRGVSNNGGNNPKLVAELRLLRHRREELESRMSALQTSRGELMEQLMSLMRLIKMSPLSTPTPASSPRLLSTPTSRPSPTPLGQHFNTRPVFLPPNRADIDTGTLCRDSGRRQSGGKGGGKCGGGVEGGSSNTGSSDVRRRYSFGSNCSGDVDQRMFVYPVIRQTAPAAVSTAGVRCLRKDLLAATDSLTTAVTSLVSELNSEESSAGSEDEQLARRNGVSLAEYAQWQAYVTGRPLPQQEQDFLRTTDTKNTLSRDVVGRCREHGDGNCGSGGASLQQQGVSWGNCDPAVDVDGWSKRVMTSGNDLKNRGSGDVMSRTRDNNEVSVDLDPTKLYMRKIRDDDYYRSLSTTTNGFCERTSGHISQEAEEAVELENRRELWKLEQ